MKRLSKTEYVSLIQQYKREMYLLAFSVVKNHADAEDAVAEAILKSFEKMGSLKDIEKFKYWLMQILMNNARQILRKKSRLLYNQEMEMLLTETYNFDSTIWDTVISLDGDFRTVVVLYYYEQFTVKEISNILHIPEGTVKSRLSRARDKLKVLLE